MVHEPRGAAPASAVCQLKASLVSALCSLRSIWTIWRQILGIKNISLCLSKRLLKQKTKKDQNHSTVTAPKKHP